MDWAWVQGDAALLIAGVAALVAALVSSHTILRHCCYPSTAARRAIIRIQLIVPLYAGSSWMSLRFPDLALYFDVGVRDLYEAYIVYLFVSLVVSLCGGTSKCASDLAQRGSMRHPPPLCCLPELGLNANFLRRMKQSTLQFVVVKPVMAACSILALLADAYWSPGYQGVLLVIYNVSYTVALYGLLLIYLAARDLIGDHNVGKKFLCIKGAVFLTYWQTLAVTGFGDLGEQWDDFVLCLEMVGFALLHRRAFPPDELPEPRTHAVGPLLMLRRLGEAFSLRDVVADARESFSATPALMDEYRGVALIEPRVGEDGVGEVLL